MIDKRGEGDRSTDFQVLKKRKEKFESKLIEENLIVMITRF